MWGGKSFLSGTRIRSGMPREHCWERAVVDFGLGGGGGVRICQTLFGHVIGGPLSSGSVHAQIAGCEIGKL